MPTYVYQAKKGPTETIAGEIVASSESDALAKIDRLGLSPISVTLSDKKTAAASIRLSGGRVSARDVDIFTRQLSGMIKAGVPILRALRTIQEQCESRAFQQVVGELEVGVRDGQMLSDVMERFPRVFPSLFVSMVKSGESGGVLDTILMTMADAREAEADFRRKVQSAIAYPLLMLGVGAGTVFIMVGFLLPKIVPLIQSSSKTGGLPWQTEVVMASSDWLSAHWLWVVLLFAGAVVSILQLRSSQNGRRWLDSMMLRIPFVKGFLQQIDIARFARTMSLLIRSAVPIDRALRLGGGALRNEVLRQAVEELRVGTVQQGQTLASGIRRSIYFPGFVANMVAVGEESGSLDDSLLEVAIYYEREVDHKIRIMTTLLEPILILCVGGVVGFIVFAMMLPIFQVSQTLG